LDRIDPTQSSLFLPWGNITIGNHIFSTDPNGVGAMAQTLNNNCTLTPASSAGTDVSGHIAGIVGATGNFGMKVAITYAQANGAGSQNDSYPVVILTPVVPNDGSSATVIIVATSTVGLLLLSQEIHLPEILSRSIIT